MKTKLAFVALSAVAFVLCASTASADCISKIFGVRVQHVNDIVYVQLERNNQGVVLCNLADGPKCQTMISLAMAALLSGREVRFASGGGAGTCAEYVAGEREIAYMVLH